MISFAFALSCRKRSLDSSLEIILTTGCGLTLMSSIRNFVRSVFLSKVERDSTGPRALVSASSKRMVGWGIFSSNNLLRTLRVWLLWLRDWVLGEYSRVLDFMNMGTRGGGRILLDRRTTRRAVRVDITGGATGG